MRVSIVGAGPVGCLTALYGLQDHDVTVYEASRDKRMQCSGLISKDGLMSLGVPLKKNLIQNRVRGAVFYSPSGESFTVDGRQDKAYVLDRVDYDNFLLDNLLDWDVDVIEKKVKASDVKQLLKYDDRVVLATGTDYSLQRSLKINTPTEYLYGAQYEIKVDADPDFVQLHFNQPDFFSWVIPVDEYARVGLCSKSNPTPELHRFIKKLGAEGQIKSYHIRDEHYGVIPIYNPSLTTYRDRIALVGDAAAQVKASTGGGVVMGGRAAKHVFKQDYEHSWRRELGMELKAHLMVYKFISRLKEENKNKLFSSLAEHKHILEEKGDMDSAIKSLSPIIRNPSFASAFIRNLPSIAYDIYV